MEENYIALKWKIRHLCCQFLLLEQPSPAPSPPPQAPISFAASLHTASPFLAHWPPTSRSHLLRSLSSPSRNSLKLAFTCPKTPLKCSAKQPKSLPLAIWSRSRNSDIAASPWTWRSWSASSAQEGFSAETPSSPDMNCAPEVATAGFRGVNGNIGLPNIHRIPTVTIRGRAVILDILKTRTLRPRGDLFKVTK